MKSDSDIKVPNNVHEKLLVADWLKMSAFSCDISTML